MEEKIKKIGEYIQNRRKALNLSIRDLSKISGVSKSLISELEIGNKKSIPKLKTLLSLDKALKSTKYNLCVMADYVNADFAEKNKAIKGNEPTAAWQEKIEKILKEELKLSDLAIKEALKTLKSIKTLDCFDESIMNAGIFKLNKEFSIMKR